MVLMLNPGQVNIFQTNICNVEKNKVQREIYNKRNAY